MSKVLKAIKKKITNKKNISPTSKYVRAVDARNAAIKKAFGDNF
tara:strand:- start:62 stop:193 length:132 start_codon:yes stop_codon:yes gene_type:complete